MTFTSLIETLNIRCDYLARVAWPLFWQSSILIVGMFCLDHFVKRKLRPSVRHALWLIVLVKVLLPPSFASPTGIAWWLRPREAAPAIQPTVSYVVTYGPARTVAPVPTMAHIVAPAPHVHLAVAAWALAGAVAISAALLMLMLVRWARLKNQLGRFQPAPIWVDDLVRDLQGRIRYRRPVRLTLTDISISPALCGLFQPVVILPMALVERLTPSQLRAVLLHELFHLRNGDVWINCFQSLLQIVFWWHPLLWLANARIRRIREEAVDDAVRLALGDEAATYAPTLLEVARLSLRRPLATLGLVGILESRQALRQRVERMVSLPAPKRTGLTLGSMVGIVAFTSVAVPMGQAPPKPVKITTNAKPTLYYSFDQSFWDYFGSNGVNAVEAGLEASAAQDGFSAKIERYDAGLPRSGPQDPGPKSDHESSDKNNSAATDRSSWNIQPLTENGQVNFDVASGIISATNGAVVTLGDTTLSADRITANRDTGEIAAEGSARLQHGSRQIESSRISVNATNLQLAQAQSSVGTPTRIYTSKARGAILNKLETIRLNNVSFDNLPLSEVINVLRDEAKKRDPEGKGINLLLYPFADTPRSPGAIDPATGLPVATPEVEPVAIDAVTIRIMPPLNDVRMIDVLDAITKVADKRIRYTLEEYGVAFRLAGRDTPIPLFTRTIRIDPNTFAQGLESVVGVSVGTFQTGGQGGGGQQGNAGGVTIPRVQVAPNGAGGVGGQVGGQGGQGGGVQGGGISGVTRPTAAISQDAVRQFVASLGVDLSPPKSVFYNYGNSSLLIHAAKSDLDAIENAINAFPAGVEKPTGSGKIETPTNSLSLQTNQAKLPVLGDLPVVGRVFTRTVEVVSAASPTVSSEKTIQNSNPQLLTRIIRIAPHIFLESVKKVGGLADNASSQDIMNAFRKMLSESGLELLPPKTLFYNERTGDLLMRATAQDLDLIEKFIQVLNLTPAQVNIRAAFVEASDEASKWLNDEVKGEVVLSLALIGSSSGTNQPWVKVLADEQFKSISGIIKQHQGLNVMADQNVTTLSGRQAQMQTVEVQSIVTLNPQALVPPGVVSSNLYTAKPLSFGPVLDIIPVVAPDGATISLNITAQVSELLNNDLPQTGEAAFVYVDGKVQSVKPPLTRICISEWQAATLIITNGQTAIIGRPSEVITTYDKEGNAITSPGASRKNLFLFLTATLIDPAGNPIRSAKAPLIAPGK